MQITNIYYPTPYIRHKSQKEEEEERLQNGTSNKYTDTKISRAIAPILAQPIECQATIDIEVDVLDLETKETFAEMLYPNNLKNREFGKKAPQNFYPERATIDERQGASEDEDFWVKPTSPKTNSSSYLGIKRRGFDIASEHLTYALIKPSDQPEVLLCKSFLKKITHSIKKTAKKVKEFAKEHPILTTVIVLATVAVIAGTIAGMTAGGAAVAANPGKKKEDEDPETPAEGKAPKEPPVPKDQPLLQIPFSTLSPTSIKDYESIFQKPENFLSQTNNNSINCPFPNTFDLGQDAQGRFSFREVLLEVPHIAPILFNNGLIQPQDLVVNLPATKPTPVRPEEHQYQGKMDLLFINGILNDRKSALEGAKYLQKLAGGPPITLVHLPSFGLTRDIMIADQARDQEVMNSTALALKEQVMAKIARSNPQDKIVIVCHSAGAINTDAMLKEIPKEYQSQIIIYAVAPGKFILDNKTYTIENLISEGGNDPVVDFQYERRKIAEEQGVVTAIPKHPEAGLVPVPDFLLPLAETCGGIVGMVATEAFEKFLTNEHEMDKALIDHELMSKTFENPLKIRLKKTAEIYNAWDIKE